MGSFVFCVFLLIMFQEILGGLEEDKPFSDQFPVWRGVSSLIFYGWVLGLNILFFKSSRINY